MRVNNETAAASSGNDLAIAQGRVALTEREARKLQADARKRVYRVVVARESPAVGWRFEALDVPGACLHDWLYGTCASSPAEGDTVLSIDVRPRASAGMEEGRARGEGAPQVSRGHAPSRSPS